MLHLRQKKARNSTKHITVKYVTPVIIMGAFLTGIPGLANAMPLLPVETTGSHTLVAQTDYTVTSTVPTVLPGSPLTRVLSATPPAPAVYIAEPHKQMSRKTVKNKVYRSVWHGFSVPYAVAHSPAAKDMRGAEPSLYRGEYYHADQEQFRLCVGQREGKFTYMVRGGGGNNYYGTYQFHRDFQNGIPYMMAKESRRTGDGLVKDILKLRHIPINKWNRYYQDRSMYTVLNYNGKWSGRHHWNGGSHSC